MSGPGFLEVIGCAGIDSAVAAPEVIKKFDPSLQLVEVATTALSLDVVDNVKVKERKPFQQFMYHLGHDKYGRIFLHNLLNGEYIMYEKKTKAWVLSSDPARLPPPREEDL